MNAGVSVQGKKKTPVPSAPGSLMSATGLERGVSSPERNGPGQRPRTRPNSVAIVAALHDPLTAILADDLADVMTPDNDRADRRSTGIRPIMSPRPGEVIGRAGVAADLPAHIPPAPCPGPAGIMVTTGVVVMAMV